jgi:hypothetical protein
MLKDFIQFLIMHARYLRQINQKFCDENSTL